MKHKNCTVCKRGIGQKVLKQIRRETPQAKEKPTGLEEKSPTSPVEGL
jgi:hypothetical protein